MKHLFHKKPKYSNAPCPPLNTNNSPFSFSFDKNTPLSVILINTLQSWRFLYCFEFKLYKKIQLPSLHNKKYSPISLNKN